MAKIELFLIDDKDQTVESTAIEGDFPDMKELYDEMKITLDEETEDVPEPEPEPEPEGAA